MEVSHKYCTLSALFGFGWSTVGAIVVETTGIIASNLFSHYVSFPAGEKLRDVVANCKTRWGFPQVAGAIDGSHIPIVRPSENASDYYDCKGYYSVLMWAVVDYHGMFLDAYIGWPGKMHDAQVFVNSSLYHKGRSGSLLPDWKQHIAGIEVPLVILGDPGYSLLSWLMKPYLETAHSATEKRCNYRQCIWSSQRALEMPPQALRLQHC